jgi:ribonuclease BN (tRNA processing enzyme)
LDTAPARVSIIAESYHTSTRQLAELANLVKPRLLVLYHVQNYSGDPNAPIDELRAAGYEGQVILAADQDIY